VRLARMLDAAAHLADEVGYDDVTTSLIARRADVSVGSLYQFFADKRAIYRALALDHMARFLQRLEAGLDAADLRTWEDLVDATVDAYVEMLRSTPGFQGFGDVIDDHLLDAERDNDTVLADRLLGVLVDRLDAHPDESLRLALLTAVTVGDAMLSLAFRRAPGGDPAVITETKRLVRACLVDRLGEPLAARRARRR
jgi:AcrR family transcriptional regulator